MSIQHFGRLVGLCLALLIPPATPARAGGDAVTTLAVEFTVRNRNRTLVPCLADGRNYQVQGHLVHPGGTLPSALTLYLHGLGFGEFFWRFPVPGYDFAHEMALLGHASLVIDRLGYDASGHPDGRKLCIGGHADVAHQVIQQLRAGSYSVAGGTPTPISRIALVGHSLGGAVAEVEAYSFKDVDALGILAFADLGATPDAVLGLTGATLECALGGRAAEPGSAKGYAPFGANAAQFQRFMFHDADPAVVAQATALRNPDPCGDFLSVLPANLLTTVHLAALRDIRVPAFLLCAQNDALFQPAGCPAQRTLMSGITAFTSVMIPDMGHAVTLERHAPEVRAALSAWLWDHGF